MPTYEYKCERCGYSFEIHHSMKEDPGVNCSECGASAKRIITGGSGFILKTTGTSSISDSQGTKCGKEQTCCGKETPCEIRPCEK
jgi:putative FmdB family regulatory protein